eukprot:184181_1
MWFEFVFWCYSFSIAKKPNIIFIISDDLGYDDLGFQSHQILTPNIDKLRSEGQFLEYYYGQPNCSPTRSSLLTGMYPIHTGITTWIHPTTPIGAPLNLTFVSKQLLNNGYQTHAVGKWHVGFYKWAFTPTFRGFKSFYGYYGGGEDYYTHKESGYYDFRDDRGLNCGYNCSQVSIESYKNYSAYLFSQRAIDIIQNHTKYNNDSPLFLYLAYQSVHAPAEVDKQYIDAYNGIIQSQERKVYAGMLSCMDEGIGNITAVLQENGYLDNNTIIVFTSDNGGLIPIPQENVKGIGGCNYPLRGGKQAIYEGGVKLTGFVWGTPDIIPSSLKGGSYSQLFHTVDWYYTLLSMAGIDTTLILNYTIDGVDQWNGIIGNEVKDKYFEFRDEIYYGCDIYNGEPSNNTGYRYQWYKIFNSTGGYPNTWWPPPNETVYVDMIHMNYKDDDLYELFNISNDPYEYNDISKDNPSLVQQLLAKMDAISATAIPNQVDKNCPKVTHPNYTIVGEVWQPWCDNETVV